LRRRFAPRNDGERAGHGTICLPRANQQMRMTLRSGDLPVGQKTVQPRLQKYSCFVPTQITSLITPSRPTEGRFAVVTNAGRDAVDAGGAEDEGATSGRRSRVVLTPRRRQVCGSISAGDGDKKPDRRGTRRKPLKPLRGECRVIFGVTVVTNSRVFFYTRGCGRIERPAFPAPSDVSAGGNQSKTRALGAARSRDFVCNC
jgi:hypothetical protein